MAVMAAQPLRRIQISVPRFYIIGVSRFAGVGCWVTQAVTHSVTHSVSHSLPLSH
jgi:hypothetical protein